jgi:hypothetical protein
MLRFTVVAAALVLLSAALPAGADWWPADIVRANRVLQTAKSYRIVTTEGPSVTIVEVQRPDRERINMNGQIIVRIGERVWLHNPGESWREVGNTGAGRIAALGDIALPPNAAALREADASDGVETAHLYHIIYPSGTPQLRWYVRVSDGRLHAIRRAGKNYPVTATIDRYNDVPPIKAPVP